MKLSPGDQIQIILTTGGVPYAKTRVVEPRKYHVWLPISPYDEIEEMMNQLLDDIDLYGDEHEHEWHCTHDESKLVCLRCEASMPLIGDRYEEI